MEMMRWGNRAIVERHDGWALMEKAWDGRWVRVGMVSTGAKAEDWVTALVIPFDHP